MKIAVVLWSVDDMDLETVQSLTESERFFKMPSDESPSDILATVMEYRD